jgi:hypothetical protein
MVRVPMSEFDAALRKRHVRPMDFTGKPLTGFVYVSPSGIRTAVSLRRWLTLGERAQGVQPPSTASAALVRGNDETQFERAPERATVRCGCLLNPSQRARVRV